MGQDQAAASRTAVVQNEPGPPAGRPAQGARTILTILWVRGTGASWDDVPKEPRFVAFQTTHRYLSECFIDGSFVPAKGGDAQVGYGRKGKGSTLELIVEAKGLPSAARVAGATVHETQLVELVLSARFVEDKPEPLGGDKSYGSGPLDEQLAAQGIEMILGNGSIPRSLLRIRLGTTLQGCGSQAADTGRDTPGLAPEQFIQSLSSAAGAP